jgi:hypothetical protein
MIVVYKKHELEMFWKNRDYVLQFASYVFSETECGDYEVLKDRTGIFIDYIWKAEVQKLVPIQMKSITRDELLKFIYENA